MKTEKQESPVKALKKKTKDSIHKRLAKVLRSITSELGQDEKNVSIDIEKESKKLAKKIVKGLIIKQEPVKEKEKVTAPVKESAPVTAKPAAKKAPAPKSAKNVAAPAKKAVSDAKKPEPTAKNGAIKHSAQKATKK
ncbi:MAG TPA: hypothetical protein VHB54_04875 [Mucilaginibacter sp.]|nr:hypothetical protein [Mucilaginibacter sp.]